MFGFLIDISAQNPFFSLVHLLMFLLSAFMQIIWSLFIAWWVWNPAHEISSRPLVRGSVPSVSQSLYIVFATSRIYSISTSTVRGRLSAPATQLTQLQAFVVVLSANLIHIFLCTCVFMVTEA